MNRFNVGDARYRPTEVQLIKSGLSKAGKWRYYFTDNRSTYCRRSTLKMLKQIITQHSKWFPEARLTVLHVLLIFDWICCIHCGQYALMPSLDPSAKLFSRLRRIINFFGRYWPSCIFLADIRQRRENFTTKFIFHAAEGLYCCISQQFVRCQEFEYGCEIISQILSNSKVVLTV